jgi:LysM repeat protein
MRAERNLTSIAAVVALALVALLATGTHTVQRGETLTEIGARYGVSASELARANGISNPDRVRAGTRLQLSGASTPANSYRVRSGDTLGSIASRAGTTIAALVSANGLKSPHRVRVGQVLTLPGASAAPSGAAPTSAARHHVVRAGETISGIAARYGISQRQLVDANGLTGGVVYAGQRLSLEPADAPPVPTGGSATHKVAAGQALSAIAQHYGTTVKAIQNANGISDPNHVVVGMILTIPSSVGGSTSLRCPVQGRVTFMNDWGFPRSGGRFHEGNDFFASRGTPAVAVANGLASQKTGSMAGRQVTLRGDDGSTYYYMHLDRFGASGRVEAGTEIGYVGSSGNAAGTSPHVHFEMHRPDGAAVNPYPHVRAAC